jgi:hypothetical protein
MRVSAPLALASAHGNANTESAVLAAVEGEYGGIDSDAGERLVDYATGSPAACASRAMAERKTLKSKVTATSCRPRGPSEEEDKE